MPQIILFPHQDLCPDGAVIEVEKGTSVLDGALSNSIGIEHNCEKVCACTTCHVIIREGFDSLDKADELEGNLLAKLWGSAPGSRLSCQTIVKDDDLVVEIPEYF